MNLLKDLIALEQAVTTAPVSAKSIWEALRVVGDDIFGVAAPLTMQASASSDKDVKECVERIRVACANKAGEEALGDGKILQAIMQILPIILSLFGV